MNEIIHGDCREVLKTVPNGSVDLLVTDPPYGLSFMGKKWDKAVPPTSVWAECLRVLKSGSFAFVMCIPRLDCLTEMERRLRKAGFVTSFSPIFWAFAQGFPKPANLGKAAEKRYRPPDYIKPVDALGGMHSEKGYNVTKNQYFYNEYKSPQAQALDGAYTYNLKPAVEVIIVAQKPLLHKSYTEQAMAWAEGEDVGMGGVWVDDTRIPVNPETDDMLRTVDRKPRLTQTWKEGSGFKNEDNRLTGVRSEGRFPANLLISDEILNNGKITKGVRAARGGTNPNPMDWGGDRPDGDKVAGYDDKGQFSRFFSLDSWWNTRLSKLPKEVQKTFPFLTVPKPSKSEKGDDNTHPTVKPVKLMSYLITLGSRRGDVVLDPFVGSGTTCVAAKAEGRKFIGIELSEENVKIANQRLEGTYSQDPLW